MESCVSSLVSLLSPGLAVGPSLSCGGALGLWWVGLPLEAGSELPSGRDLPQDLTNQTETAANQNSLTAAPLFLRFACQAQSRSQQNLSVQTQDQRVRTTRTVTPGTELLLRPNTDPDAAGNSKKAHEKPPTENTTATVTDEALGTAAAEKHNLLKETASDGSKMEDRADNATRRKNKTQETKTAKQKPEGSRTADSGNDAAKRLETEEAGTVRRETAPPTTVRCSSRLALKPRLVHRLTSRVTAPLRKPALMNAKPQTGGEGRRGEGRRGEEEERRRVGVATESTGEAQVEEMTGAAVTVETTGAAVTVESTGGRERRHTCSTCGRSFYQKSHLKKHQVTHSDQKPFTCDKCHKKYSSKESYRAHQLLHQGERPFPCPLCPKAYGLRRDLKDHLVLHSGLTPHLCPHCGRGFTRRPSLRAHQLNHCPKRPTPPRTKFQVQCSVCTKFLSNPGSLKNHMRVHTGERPHTCQHCGKSFSQRGYVSGTKLRRHLRSAHSTEKPFTCHCGAAYSLRQSLTRHQALHRLDETGAGAGAGPQHDRPIRGQDRKSYKDSRNPEEHRGEQGEGLGEQGEGLGEEGHTELLLIQEVAETVEINTA
ncbi:zinc finger protein 408-like [Boleophthalmus pectinirostris]|uniref:zinc finger protein 408-like n=1 Tax=Boleophthalmus pectinirostris TaxID=150288 RepID=UPI00242DA40A|nr:zinc finger protein 408-like [Boleophthalmus pectinirostris]